ncbi:MAG: hypothetical protein JWO30_778 [Fibrobacteres bacterium]|nr:hypothetical protein [Fibrobacterota bacterium]
MFRSSRIRPALVLAALLSWLSGCFTEVGNAEDDRLVEAKFQIDYNPNALPLPKSATLKADSLKVTILRFYLNLREAEFHLFDSLTNRKQDFHLWKDDVNLLPVDFTGRDTAATLPTQKVGVLNPLEMYLKCVLPTRAILKPDTVDFEGFANRGYIKGWYVTGRDTTRFLFALPKAGDFQLMYSKEALNGWYADGTYRCQFVFYANRWMAAADLTGAVCVKDKRGALLLVLDPEHNGAIHEVLETSFNKSFNASKVTYTAAP